MADSRSRSRSPPRSKSKPKSSHSSGFRWKEKRPRDEEQDGEQRLERGYRHERDGYRDRERKRDSRDRGRDQGRDQESASRENRDRLADDEQEKRKKDNYNKGTVAARAAVAPDDDIARKFGSSYSSSSISNPSSIPNDLSTGASKLAKISKPKVATGPMIVVKVNDRLGTTSKIPCLPSDSVGDFKKLVAMQIGRKPHEIMLKRQSERPFKDFLTLEDYGVSDGVQLDLELDTGD